LEIPIFQKVNAIQITPPNPLDRSLWRLQDYKDEMRKLKKTYADSGELSLSKCFKQVHFHLIDFFSKTYLHTGSSNC